MCDFSDKSTVPRKQRFTRHYELVCLVDEWLALPLCCKKDLGLTPSSTECLCEWDSHVHIMPVWVLESSNSPKACMLRLTGNCVTERMNGV